MPSNSKLISFFNQSQLPLHLLNPITDLRICGPALMRLIAYVVYAQSLRNLVAFSILCCHQIERCLFRRKTKTAQLAATILFVLRPTLAWPTDLNWLGSRKDPLTRWLRQNVLQVLCLVFWSLLCNSSIGKSEKSSVYMVITRYISGGSWLFLGLFACLTGLVRP